MSDEMTEEIVEEEIAIDLDEIAKKYEEKGFFKRLGEMFKGLSKPHDTREYKIARIELQRLAAPLTAIVVPIVFGVVLCVVTMISGQKKDVIIADIAQIEEEPEEFRRDPFWPVALVRARKAEHDARIAARIESEKRRAAIEKARQEAAVLGLDVSEMSDEDLADIYGEDAPPDRSKGATSFAGATDGEWVAAEARIPPRSGYLGGKRPALMLKGDKRPHFEGDDICVTNHGVVFTWRISKVDFRAYSHELERVSAQSVIP